MNISEDIQRLTDYLKSGASFVNGEEWHFEGAASSHPNGRASLELALGYTIPENVAAFIAKFGGTELFIGFGHGVQVFPFAEVVAKNIEMQIGEAEFFPKFVIFGFDQMDDMLCLYNDGSKIHFGHLNHEAWGFPDLWPNDGATFCMFDEWLEMLVATGCTIPVKELRYEA